MWKQYEEQMKSEEYRHRMVQAQLDMMAGMAQSPQNLLAALMGQWEPLTCTAARESDLISLEVQRRPLWDRVRDWLVRFLRQEET